MKNRIRVFAAAVCAMVIMSSCSIFQTGQTSKTSSESGSSVSQKNQETESQQDKSDPSGENSGITPESSSDSGKTSQETENSKTSADESSKASAESSGESSIIPTPYCRSAVLYSVDDKKIIYDDGADIVTAPASMTKLLTASVMLNNMNENDIVTVGSELDLVHADSSICYISVGNQIKVRDLLTGMLLNSGNDAAYTAAVTTARAVHSGEELSDREAVEIFCGMMNSLASQIGMNSSHFSTPDGWDDDDQYVTAADMAKLCEYALGFPVIREIVGTHQKSVVFESGESITWTNTNELLDPDSAYYCENAIGMKTGTTDNAGCCLAAAFEKDGRTYISVVTGCGTSSDRYEMTLKVFNKAK